MCVFVFTLCECVSVCVCVCMCVRARVLVSFSPSICLPLRCADLHICLCLVMRALLLIDFSIAFNQLRHLSPICCHISVSLINLQLKLTAQAAPLQAFIAMISCHKENGESPAEPARRSPLCQRVGSASFGRTFCLFGLIYTADNNHSVSALYHFTSLYMLFKE